MPPPLSTKGDDKIGILEIFGAFSYNQMYVGLGRLQGVTSVNLAELHVVCIA